MFELLEDYFYNDESNLEVEGIFNFLGVKMYICIFVWFLICCWFFGFLMLGCDFYVFDWLMFRLVW